MSEFTPSSIVPVLKLLNYTTPPFYALYFVATLLSSNTRNTGFLSKKKKAILVGLSSATTLSYTAQALQYVPNLSSAPDNALVHSLAQILLWICVTLLSLSAVSRISTTFTSFIILNLGLETAICTLTFRLHQQLATNEPHILEAFQILTSTILAIFSLFTIIWTRSDEGYTPLLSSDATASSPLLESLPETYSALVREEEGHKTTESKTEDDSDSDSDSDDDDEKEMIALHKQRLDEDGGWINYLKAFGIFLPFIFPRDNYRLKGYILVMIINTIIERALNVLRPREMGIIVDILINEKRMPWKEIATWSVMGIAANESCGLGFITELLKIRLAAWSRQQLSVASLDHVMNLSMNFHDQKDSGEIIKAIEQAGSINNLIEICILDLVPGVLDIAVAMWYITYLFDIYALLILIAATILFVSGSYYVTNFASVAKRIAAQRERTMSKVIYESVSNWYSIMCLNRRNHTMSRLRTIVGSATKGNVHSEDLYAYTWCVQELAEAAGRIGITLLAARRIVMGVSTIGDLFTLEGYWMTLVLPLYVLGRSYRSFNSDLVDAERLLQLFKESPMVKDSQFAYPLGSVDGRIVFKDVQFDYPGRGKALHDLDLTIDAGQTVALVGETGGGKSTVLKLLMRFYDLASGSITIDGHELRDLTLDSLRGIFGFVPQDSVLFNTSILENVRFGNIEATDAEVYEACKAAAIHDTILSFPSGYASKVGERGVKLSGGERQRIAIARVFLKNPQIVLLDEATSAMDSQTEAEVQAAFKRLTKGKTTVVIAHRLSTVMEADKILVIDKGTIIEMGTHEELLAKSGRYSALWNR